MTNWLFETTLTELIVLLLIMLHTHLLKKQAANLHLMLTAIYDARLTQEDLEQKNTKIRKKSLAHPIKETLILM